MNRMLLSALFFSVPSFAIAQPALMEAPEFPAVRPGPNGVHDGASCFLLASGSVTPGDVDWVQVMIPWTSSRTVVDVDFPAGVGSSVVLGSRIAGNTVLGMADGNAARDALCGLSGSTSPVGSPTDSAIEMGPTPHHAVIDIGVSGSPDTSLSGNHTQSFSYQVWVYVNPILCHTDAECVDNVACTEESCDVATGVCNSTPNHNECQDSSWCNGQEVCSVTLGCRPGLPVNCNDGVSCTQDTCNENLDTCVHTPRDNLCNNGTFCDGDEWCDAQLGCQAGEPVDCDDGDDCTVDSCDLDTDDCVSVSSDSACDDGLFCNGVETCDQESGCAEGEDPCPNQLCDEAHDRCADCLSDADCDDGVFCNGAEVCDSGTSACQDGDAPDCDDDVDCTADACDEAQNRCVNTPRNVMCDDGLFCNGVETCDAAEGCVDGAAPCGTQMCDELANHCVDCMSDGDCDDGVFCNGQETCTSAGACVDGNVPCADSLCDEDGEQCVECLSDEDCSDGVFCNGAEVCDTGVCFDGRLPTCEDDDNCTTDYCDEDADKCAHSEQRGGCDDGVFCNGSESCGYLGCQPGTPPCHDSMCDEVNDRCVVCLTDSDCNNGVFCDGVEYCEYESGRCRSGPAPACDDENECTADRCDVLADTCAHVPSDAACDDGVFCNGLERCDAEAGCVKGDEPCGDGFCDESANRCVDCQSDADCDDGVFCNGDETCNTATGSCQSGAAPCGSSDQCDEESESCVAAAMAIDIAPAMCPNYHKPLKNDFLKVAIVGSQSFNVSQVDLSSLVLRRSDGTGSGVEPMRHKHSRHRVLNDVSRDGKADGCDCNGLGGDGIADLVLKFDNDQLVRHLRLDRMRTGTTVDLVLTGQMLDGTPFEAMDCVTLGAPKKNGKQ